MAARFESVAPVFEAWPCRWKAPELNSASDTRIVAEIEFAVEKVERA